MQSQPFAAPTDRSAPATPEDHFAERVREARERLSWSQVRLAAELRAQGYDLDATTITRIERGERRIRLDDAVALAGVLGLDLAWATGPDPVDLRAQIDRAEVEQEAALQAARYWEIEAAAAAERRTRLREMLVEALEQGRHARGVDQEEA